MVDEPKERCSESTGDTLARSGSNTRDLSDERVPLIQKECEERRTVVRGPRGGFWSIVGGLSFAGRSDHSVCADTERAHCPERRHSQVLTAGTSRAIMSAASTAARHEDPQEVNHPATSTSAFTEPKAL